MYKIFLVEDDKVIRRTVAEHLSMWGYEVRPAQDFTHILDEFLEFSPHLVLLDIGLPCLNPHQSAQETQPPPITPVV